MVDILKSIQALSFFVLFFFLLFLEFPLINFGSITNRVGNPV